MKAKYEHMLKTKHQLVRFFRALFRASVHKPELPEVLTNAA
jgi:hypothetical protein